MPLHTLMAKIQYTDNINANKNAEKQEFLFIINKISNSLIATQMSSVHTSSVHI